ncbi:protein phosphatase 1 regulatory subunit 36 [Ciona intestinalis]
MATAEAVRPVHGHFEWNEQSKCLEFISKDSHGHGYYDKKRRSKGHFDIGHANLKSKTTKAVKAPSIYGFSSVPRGNPGIVSSRLTGQIGGQGGSPKFGGIWHGGSSNDVTLHNVKSVAMDLLAEERAAKRTKVSAAFINLVSTQQFDNFLVTLLRYFNCFYVGLEQERHPHKTTYLEPSKAEVKALAETQQRLVVTKRRLGQAYCVIVLGLGLEKHHHMGCGKQRVSSTHRDKHMFEDMYTFCTLLIWVTYRRKEYVRVHQEMGDMLRSAVFNPANRKVKPVNNDNVKKTVKKPLGRKQAMQKPIAARIQDLLSAELPKLEKLTPAQHRRFAGKRPALMKAIHQRSSALVSLLPLPKEDASHLFGGKIPSEKSLTEIKEDSDGMFLLQHQSILPAEKLGIIGEPMEMFNPENLQPKNTDSDEEDSDSLDGDSHALPNNKPTQSDLSRHSATSRATTEDGEH